MKLFASSCVSPSRSNAGTVRMLEASDQRIHLILGSLAVPKFEAQRYVADVARATVHRPRTAQAAQAERASPSNYGHAQLQAMPNGDPVSMKVAKGGCS